MIKTETLLKQLKTYRSSSDKHSCLYACYCCLYSFEPIVQLELPKLLIMKNLRAIFRSNNIKYEHNFANPPAIDNFRPIKSIFLKRGFRRDLNTDGYYLIDSVEGLLTAHDWINDDHKKVTSSNVYSVHHMINASAASLWIRKFPLHYQRWISAEKEEVNDHYINIQECVDLIRKEWDFVANWFLDNNMVNTFSDEVQQQMQRNFDIWKDQHLFLLT